MKMELWIRSQDKTFLRKVNTIGIVEGKDFWSIDENLTISFGKYKTKERALEVLEVLDEIEERIMLINTINIAKDRDSLIACKNVLTEEKIKGLNYPYQMPKE